MKPATTKLNPIFAVIDGNSLLYRAYYAYPQTMSSADGTLVNAVFGFMTMLFKTLQRYKPTYLTIVFDKDRNTFRKQKALYYKENRVQADQTLKDQYQHLFKILEAFNCPIYQQKGYEADDFIGTFAQRFKENAFTRANTKLIKPQKMLLVTGDKDIKQALSKNVEMIYIIGTFNNQIYITQDSFTNEHGFKPALYADYLAIWGDSSDNIPGIKGIGQKGAGELVQKFGTIEQIYKKLQKVNDYNPRYAKLLTESEQNAAESKFLTSLQTDLDIDLNLQPYMIDDMDPQKLLSELSALGFRSLVSGFEEIISLYSIQPRTSQLSPTNVEKLTNVSVAEFKKALKPQTVIYLYKQGTSQHDSEKSTLFAQKPEAVQYHLCFNNKICSTDFETILELLGLKNVETIVYHDTDDYIEILDALPDAMSKFYDLKLMAYLQNSSRRNYDLPTLAIEIAGLQFPQADSTPDVQGYLSTIKHIYEILHEKENTYQYSKFVDYHWEMEHKIFKKHKLDLTASNHLRSLLILEVRVAQILYHMEQRGILVDTNGMKELEQSLKTELNILEQEIFAVVGHEFNVASPKQIAELIYDELRITLDGKPPKKRSTSADTLSELTSAHPVIPLILKHREKSKLYSTYAKGFEKFVSHEDGKSVIHTNYQQTAVVTGRLSSTAPNLQNLPIRSEEGRGFRKLFVPRDGFGLYAFDYSQFELRLLAHFSEDPELLHDFHEHKDIHLTTAARIFNIPENEVTPEQRRIGKTINFGVMYGLSPFGLARQLNIDVHSAAEYIKFYFEQYDGVKFFLDDIIEKAKENLYVDTAFGRRRQLPFLTSSNKRFYASAVRETINMPAQGTQADLMKISMILVDNLIKKRYNNKAFVLLQIHDELVIELAHEIEKKAAKDIKETMESIAELAVPLVVSAGKWDEK